jgi:TPR repeat protein
MGKNDEAAVRLYRDAAGKNYPAALSGLGWMYEQGRVDGQPNEVEARRLYERAAALGDRYAARALQRLDFQ